MGEEARQKKLEELAKGLGEKLDAAVKRSLRSDLDSALRENQCAVILLQYTSSHY